MDQHMNFIADLANCLDNVMQRPKKADAADRQARWAQLVQWAQLSTLDRLKVNIASGQSVGHTGRASIAQERGNTGTCTQTNTILTSRKIRAGL